MDILKKYTHGEVSNVADAAPKKEKPSAQLLKKYAHGELSGAAEAKAGKEGLDKDTMMKELIEDEYNYRINDTVEDLKEEIEYLQEYTIL